MCYSNELYHYGILGMKWGIRRYQNDDGTLTDEGKKRYLGSNGKMSAEGVKLYNKDTRQFYNKLGDEVEKLHSPYYEDETLERFFNDKEAVKKDKELNDEFYNYGDESYEFLKRYLDTSIYELPETSADVKYYADGTKINKKRG